MRHVLAWGGTRIVQNWFSCPRIVDSPSMPENACYCQGLWHGVKMSLLSLKPDYSTLWGQNVAFQPRGRSFYPRNSFRSSEQRADPTGTFTPPRRK